VKRKSKICRLPAGPLKDQFDAAARKAARFEKHKENNRKRQTAARERRLARQAWERQCAKEEAATERLLTSYRAAMHNEMERAWLEQELARVKKVGREIARDMARAERKELLRRGVVHGRMKR